MGADQLVTHGLLTGKTLAVDPTTLEATAAKRSIVRRETGETYQAYLTQLAAASGIETPAREALARFDRRRKKKGSNDDWTHPDDPDSGAIVAVTVQGADVGDTSSVIETVVEAAEQLERAGALNSPTNGSRTRATTPTRR